VVIVMQELLTVFVTVFIAEFGDKTQLVTLLLAAKGQHHPVWTFAAAAAALIASTGAAVLIGSAAEQHLNMIPLKLIAGLVFVAIGVWTIWTYFAGS
jgi:putative Ca2+/H+ antiporter (TMEM165/GDT1 family)